MKIRIVSLKGRETNKVYEITEEQLVHFGRGSQNEVNLEEISISRNHLILMANPPEISVYQCQGRNETYLIRGTAQPQLIEDKRMDLQDGDVIRFVYPDERCVAEVKIEVVVEQKVIPVPAEKNPTSQPEKEAPAAGGQDPMFLLGKELDITSTGTVYVVKKRDTGRYYAFKQILVNESDKVAMQILKKELNVARRLVHKNIARVYSGGRLINGLHWGVLTEYAPDGSVAQYLQKNDLTEREAVDITIQVLHALEYAHGFSVYTLPPELQEGYKNGIVHGNINPNTVLLKKNNNTFVAKVVDFGLEKAFRTPLTPGFQLSSRKDRKDLVVTNYFMPKHQFFHGGIIRPEDDVFSAIALLYYMLTGNYIRPYQNDSFVFFEGDIRPIRSIKKSVTPKLAELIDEILNDVALDSKLTAHDVRMKLENYNAY